MVISFSKLSQSFRNHYFASTPFKNFEIAYKANQGTAADNGHDGKIHETGVVRVVNRRAIAADLARACSWHRVRQRLAVGRRGGEATGK
jgi:hypothetical protein